MPSNSLLPCCAFIPELSKTKHLTREEIEEKIKRGESPFQWRKKFFPEEKHNPTHLDSLEEYNIPFIIDIHAHFFPQFVMKLIWRWFDLANWGIQYRYEEKERLLFLSLNKIEYFTTLN